MEPIQFGNLENSIGILVNEIWQSPDWVEWYDGELDLNIQDGLRVEISLQGLGGSAAFARDPNGTSVLFPGAPIYDMSESNHKDLTFVAQVAVDLFYLLEKIRRSKVVNADDRYSKSIVAVVGPLIMFLKMALEQRPELIQQSWYGHALDALKNAGVPLDLD
jgi:hypothetical protein